MDRFNPLALALTVVLFAELGTLPSRAQAPPSPPKAAPAADALTTPPLSPQSPPLPPPTLELPKRMELPAKPSQKTPLERPPHPGGEVIDLKLPPTEPGDLRFPINLATALRLADARPLIVGAASAGVWVAEAKLQKAKVLWVPTLNLATDYVRHDGYGPDLNRGVNIPEGENALRQNSPGDLGRPLGQNVNWMYSGAGFTWAPSGPNYFYQPLPGEPLLPSPQFQYTADMVFEPLHQRQLLNSARWDIQTAKNDALLMTATAYFNVHKFRGQYAVFIDAVQRGRKLVEQINTIKSDLVPAVEVDRARNLLADLEQETVAARQSWRVASASLTRVLRLDPRAVVEPLEHDHLQITLIDPARSLDDLIPIGLTNRPELASHQALVQATLVAIRREKARPLMPSIFMNGFQSPYELIEVGALGEGNGGKMNIWGYRDDITPQVLFIAEGMGFRNAAMVKEQRGAASKSIVELFQIQDTVAADITRSQADLQSAAGRVVQSERELKAAIINYNGNVEGLGQTRRFGNVLELIVRPQEAVFALQLLMRAYMNYIATVAEYNTAQFQLFHDLGYPARELSFMRRPGAVLPVNTSRPNFLPPVGSGLPPATR